MVADTPEMKRYTCGFRTALAVLPGVVEARVLGLAADHLHVEIWHEPENVYGLSVATPGDDAAQHFFAFREQVFEVLDSKLVVTSVQEEIRATRDARRDILFLDGQGLTELSSDIGTLHEHLAVLSLSDNLLTKLPPEIALLKNLQELDVSDNRLAELPEDIGKLANLDQLSVQHNRLRTLPRSIGQLAKLRVLRVGDNQLRRLPPEIGALTQLRRLYIQQNRLSELPKEFAQLKNLYEWDFSRKSLPPREVSGLVAGRNPWVHPPAAIMQGLPGAIRDFLTAHPSKPAAAGDGYVVYADDVEHRYEENAKRRKLWGFDNCAAAIEACKGLVDGYLARLGDRGEPLLEAYRRFGEDPWVCSDDPGCVFDAWSYAEQRCAEIAAAQAAWQKSPAARWRGEPQIKRLLDRYPAPTPATSPASTGEPSRVILDRYETRFERACDGAGQSLDYYIGFDPVRQRPVALHDWMRCMLDEPLQQEIRTAIGLSHPTLVNVIDLAGNPYAMHGEYGDEPALLVVTELFDGRSLSDVLKRLGRLAEAEVLEIMAAILSAADYLHACKIDIGTIRPGRIFLSSDGMVRLVHRFMADAPRRDGPQFFEFDRMLYDPPPARGWSYSLGMVLHAMLTGLDPTHYRSKGRNGLSFAPIMPPPPSSIVPVHPHFDAVVARAMAEQPFAAPADFAAAIGLQIAGSQRPLPFQSLIPMPND